MADQPGKPTPEEMKRSLADLIEASRRLREKAKENAAEADRIMKVAKQLERVIREHTSN